MSGIRSLLCVAVMVAVLRSGQTLECFRCDLGFWDVCYTTKTNCSDGEQCFVGIGKAASVLDIKMMGCLNEEDCNKTTTVAFPVNKTVYSLTTHCCDEDRCNGSPAVLMTPLTLLALTVAQTIGLL
ncbi:sperm acrosome membrane-associated protein 4-like [Pygocentrus nattereri]|uniref:UPAR/Ly6 domain-containing protein n=1 Tax=Pygocentrus nattereri TaxID=42514 RepID=A0AAR2JR68_PYGNA|nr:sperm acrosome membrane-associated protein 4-like [Pygocentrus nattereri]